MKLMGSAKWLETERAALTLLFEEARKNGTWFWGKYHDIWFSPDELEAEHAKGNFVWGAVNWELRDPAELLLIEASRLKQAKDRFEAAAKRVGEYYASHPKAPD